MTYFVATTALSCRSATVARANHICYMVNRSAISHDFVEDEHKVRETLDEVAEPQLQRSLEISIAAVDV